MRWRVPAVTMRLTPRSPASANAAQQMTTKENGSGRQVVVPVTVLIIFLLLYLNFRRVTETLIVMLSVPFALVGGLWLMWWLGFNLSVAVAVGFIALAGVAAETGVVMLIYLDSALTDLQTRRSAEGRRSPAMICVPRSWPVRSSGCAQR
jgi:Cu/Ag efflux pump CusA